MLVSVMAVPKTRRSLTRRNKRMANVRIILPSLVQCNCGALRKHHCVCPNCKSYRGIKLN